MDEDEPIKDYSGPSCSNTYSSTGVIYFEWDYAKYKKYVDGVVAKVKPYRNNRRAGDNCTISNLIKDIDDGH